MAIDKNAVKKNAQKYASKGQYDKAIDEWKKVLKETPNDANIYNTIGDLCLKRKKGSPEAVEAYKKAADFLAADGFTSKAIALYKKAINIDPKKIDPKKIEIHLALADLNAEKGLTGNALESYKMVADFYSKKKDTVKALGIYQKMADMNPSNIAFRMKLGDMYAKEGIKRDAAKAYLEAADVYLSKDAFTEARQLFEKVLGLDPDNKQVYYKAGVVYYKEGKFVEACKAFKPAFEADSKNQELIDLYLDALAKADRGAEAVELLKELLSKDAGRIDLRESLYRQYLASKDVENALAELGTLIDAKAESSEFDAASELMNAFVEANPDHIAGHRKLSELYSTIHREDDAARELIRVAELLIAQGDAAGAKEELIRAVDLAPELPEARQRLERMDSLPEAPAAPGGVPPVSPEPAPAVSEPGQELAFSAEPSSLSAVESPGVEEDPAVVAALTEVDVLVKYGLASNAAEQLETLAGRFPESVQVRAKLRELYREQGNTAKAVEHGVEQADILTRKGMQDESKRVLLEILEIDPGNNDALARLGRETASPAGEEMAAPLTLEESLTFGAAGMPEGAVSGPEAPAVEWRPPSFESPDAEELYTGIAGQEAPPTFEESLSLEDPGAAVLSDGIASSDLEAPSVEWQPSPAERSEGELAAATVDIHEVWSEAEFYYQQGLFDEARQHYEKLLAFTPDDQRLLQRLAEVSREKEEVQEFSQLAEAVEGLEGFVPSGLSDDGALATSTSDEEAVQSLMEELKQLEPQERAGVQQSTSGLSDFARDVGSKGKDVFEPGAEIGAALETPASIPQGGGDEFFDLAAELKEELGTTFAQGAVGASEDQSLDDILEDLKQGLESQTSIEDSDTHYNLGVSYKEMELLDDAVSEFLLTREGEPKFIQSRYMLGLCYMEKGEYHKAIAELGNAVSFSESFGGEVQERIGMHYDLALAYQGAGNTDGAARQLQTVIDTDPGYRGAAIKLKELQEGTAISLDQLKEDIEREISEKFFEEGERIELEERAKKSERVSG
ncbi:MAG TPA: hypothetical protein DCO77_07855 [Nitrospiraceae bacterium]|nr:hypothetical protein [Nitrospiraceae bacterium]